MNKTEIYIFPATKFEKILEHARLILRRDKMEPTNRNIQSLVGMFLNRELLLPEMQRKYVWRATQVRDLIDSIYRDYPSGSILFWEAENLPEVKINSFETSQLPIGKRLLLLDGQQRITSLASILTGLPVRIKEGTKGLPLNNSSKLISFW